jgi:predicted nuclease of predicted toxin-antitoxin system
MFLQVSTLQAEPRRIQIQSVFLEVCRVRPAALNKSTAFEVIQIQANFDATRTCGDGQGAAMIVSHDPDFLDLVCTETRQSVHSNMVDQQLLISF